MEFEWDASKAKSNKVKHQVSFELAVTVFDDYFALIVRDEKHSNASEKRFRQIGQADSGVLVVVFTMREREGVEICRLISARKANKREKALYEINKRIPL